MDATPDVVAEEVRTKRAELDMRLNQLGSRLREADPRRLKGRLPNQRPGMTAGMLALPALAGVGVWAWRRYRNGAESLEDLLERELAELQAAEELILTALPRMAEAASSPDLRRALERHRRETEGHVERLQRVWRLLDCEPTTRRNPGIEGIIEEGRRLMKVRMAGDARDAALIAAAQKVEHYEIASYGTARAHAQTLRRDTAASLLQQTLEEERAADEKLTSLATRFVNPDAAHVRTPH